MLPPQRHMVMSSGVKKLNRRTKEAKVTTSNGSISPPPANRSHPPAASIGSFLATIRTPHGASSGGGRKGTLSDLEGRYQSLASVIKFPAT